MSAPSLSRMLVPGAMTLAALCGVTALIAPVRLQAAPGPAVQQAAQFDFEIPPASLENTLIRIARTAGGIVLFDPAATRAIDCAGVHGHFTLEQALGAALQGSPLEPVRHPDGSFGVRQRSATSASPDSADAAPDVPERDNPPLPLVWRQGQRESEPTAHGYLDSGFRALVSRLVTRSDTPLSELPLSLQAITNAVIETQQARSVVDSLQNISAVVHNRGDGIDQAGTLYVRSFVAPVMRDGWGDLVSLSSYTNGRVSGARAITSLDVPMAAIERVEVLGGADSIVVGGPMEPGGSINVVTKQPVADTVRELTLEADHRGHRRSALDLGGSLSDDRRWTYRTIISAVHDRRTLDGYDGAREFYLAPSLGYRDSQRAVVVGASQQVSRTPFGGYQSAMLNDDGPGADLRTSPWGRPDDHSQATRTELFYTWEQALGAGWRFNSKARFTRLRYSSAGYTNCTRSDTDPDSGLCVADQSLLHSDSASVDNSLTRSITSGEWTHTLMGGASFSRTRLRSYTDGSNSQVVATAWPPSPATLPPITAERSLTGGGDAIYTANVYLQDQIRWRRWHVLANVGYEQERNNFSSDIDMNGVVHDTSAPRHRPVYNLGIAYHISASATVYANTFRSFTPGQLLLDSSLNGSKPGTHTAPATTGKSVEIGLKLELPDQRATFTAALYRATHTNVLQFALSDDNLPYSSYVLLPSAVSHGMDLSLSGRLAKGWNLIASYSYSLFHPAPSEDQDSRLAQFPHHRASLWSTYDLQSEAWRGWGVGIGATMRSSYMAYSDADTQVRIAGQTRTDASLYYRSSKSRTTLGIRNLFDRRLFSDFATATIGVEPARTVTLTHIVEF